VSERTIYRDLDALSTAGVPVYAERGPGGGCVLDEQYRTNLTGLNQAEVEALFFSRSAAPLADLGLARALEGAILKLAAGLPEAQRQAAERMRRSVYLDTAGWFQFDEPATHLKTIQDGLWQERRLRIFYRRADGAWVKRLVDPYGLVAKAGVWYMVAAMGRKVAVYRVSRIMEAELLESRFERPAAFDLAEYWQTAAAHFEAGQSRFEVTIRIAPHSEPALQRVFGDAIYVMLERAEPPDEQGWCSLTIPFQSAEQARNIALGLGPLVEVVAPAELRQALVEQAARVLAMYGG
jgi:predicted DNA-binding transcriptional regulator YafY